MLSPYFQPLHKITFRDWLGAGVLVSITVFLWLCTGPAINTGDWDRVTVPAGFLAPAWEPMQSHYLLGTTVQFANNSSVGVVLSMVGWISKHASRSMVATAPVLYAFFLVLLVGVFFLAHHAHGRGEYLVVGVLILVLLCYAFYIKSFYGEALVLALTPALCVGVKQLVQKNCVLLFTLCGMAVIYAKQQMLFIVPIFLLLLFRNMWVHGGLNPRLWASLLGMILVCMAVLGAHPENRAPNQYNRYFNGLGWSLLQSADWPTQRFDERHPYFYKHQQQFQKKLPITLPQHSYLGTSYLPTASTILDVARKPEATEAQRENAQALYESLIAQGRFGAYFAAVAQHPTVLVQLIKNTYLTVVRSDYIVDYARSAVRLVPEAAQALAIVQNRLARNFGWIFVAALMLALLCRRSLFAATVTVWMLLAPLAVVVGDGFFEFEKHMTAFFVFLPCALMSAVVESPKPLSVSPPKNGFPQG